MKRADRIPLVRHIVALEVVGWRLVGLRPSIDEDGPALWRATITRCDQSASMTITAADPDAALELRAAHPK